MKSVTKREILHDSSYMKHLKSNLQKQTIDGDCKGQGERENGDLLFNGYKFSVIQSK